jgi:hypothetical protein
VIERAAREFRERYGRAPRAGELAGMAVATRGTKTVTAEVDVSAAWRAVGEEYGLDHARAERLFDRACPSASRRSRRAARATLSRSARWSLARSSRRARSRSARAPSPRHKPRERVDQLAREGELVELRDGWWTTRELRELEQRTLATVAERSDDTTATVSTTARARRLSGQRSAWADR